MFEVGSLRVDMVNTGLILTHSIIAPIPPRVMILFLQVVSNHWSLCGVPLTYV